MVNKERQTVIERLIEVSDMFESLSDSAKRICDENSYMRIIDGMKSDDFFRVIREIEEKINSLSGYIRFFVADEYNDYGDGYNFTFFGVRYENDKEYNKRIRFEKEEDRIEREERKKIRDKEKAEKEKRRKQWLELNKEFGKKVLDKTK